MQLACAIALAVLYVGLSQALIGALPESGLALWSFAVPAVVMMVTGFTAQRLARVLPMPWSDGRPYAPPPRRVHLSWRAATRVPAWLPWLLFPWNVLSPVRTHSDFGKVAWTAGASVAVIVALIARRRWRAFRLARNGQVAMALVVSRIVNEGFDDIVYEFVAADGTAVSRKAEDWGYGVEQGSSLPVFYDAANPENNVAACASWFEAQ